MPNRKHREQHDPVRPAPTPPHEGPSPGDPDRHRPAPPGDGTPAPRAAAPRPLPDPPADDHVGGSPGEGGEETDDRAADEIASWVHTHLLGQQSAGLVDDDDLDGESGGDVDWFFEGWDLLGVRPLPTTVAEVHDLAKRVLDVRLSRAFFGLVFGMKGVMYTLRAIPQVEVVPADPAVARAALRSAIAIGKDLYAADVELVTREGREHLECMAAYLAAASAQEPEAIEPPPGTRDAAG